MMWIILLLAALLVAYEQCQTDFGNSVCRILARPTLDPDDEDPTEVRALLDTVQLTPVPLTDPAAGPVPRKFRLSARYLDKNGNVVIRPSSMQWSFDPAADGSADASGEISVSAFPTSGSSISTARVVDAGMEDGVVVTRWADVRSAASAGDVVGNTEAGRPAGVAPPSVVLLEERAELKCLWGRPRAFAGAAAVGEQSVNPCSLSLLSAGGAFLFQDNANNDQWLPEKWSAPGFSVSLDSKLPVDVDITVFVAIPPDNAGVPPTAQQASNVSGPTPPLDPVLLAKNDVELANLIFESNRVGIRLKAKDFRLLPATADLRARIGADPYDCVRPVKLNGNSAAADFSYDSAAASVYYVDRINFPPDPAYPRVRGIQCHYWYSGNPAIGNPAAIEDRRLGKPPGNGPVVYISYTHHSPTTLAHELGHALGLKDEEGRLGSVDLMHNLLPDGDLGANARSYLTVGQGFRMNVWNDSYLNTRADKPPMRACDDQHPCPPVDLDVH